VLAPECIDWFGNDIAPSRLPYWRPKAKRNGKEHRDHHEVPFSDAESSV
jgi:hypothetical protein